MRTTKTVSVWPVGIGKFKVLALLVENSNAISTDYDGKTYTPIQIAKIRGHQEIVKIALWQIWISKFFLQIHSRLLEAIQIYDKRIAFEKASIKLQLVVFQFYLELSNYLMSKRYQKIIQKISNIYRK